MTDAQPHFSRRIAVQKLPRHGQRLKIVADANDCAMIAADLALSRIDAFSADVEVRPTSGGRFLASGDVTATVWQTCAVTLDDFPVDIATEIHALFAEEDRLPQVTKKEVERTLDDEDPPEPLVDGAVDVGALAVEFVALALEPFPRKPGASLPTDQENLAVPSPFAALAALKVIKPE